MNYHYYYYCYCCHVPRLYSQAAFYVSSVKNQDILNDDALHFKLARSVLKIASFELASLDFVNLKMLASFECEMRNSRVHVSGLFCDKQIQEPITRSLKIP